MSEQGRWELERVEWVSWWQVFWWGIMPAFFCAFTTYYFTNLRDIFTISKTSLFLGGLLVFVFFLMVFVFWKLLKTYTFSGRTIIYSDAIENIQGTKRERFLFADAKHYGIVRDRDGNIIAIGMSAGKGVLAKQFSVRGVNDLNKVDEMLRGKMPASTTFNETIDPFPLTRKTIPIFSGIFILLTILSQRISPAIALILPSLILGFVALALHFLYRQDVYKIQPQTGEKKKQVWLRRVQIFGVICTIFSLGIQLVLQGREYFTGACNLFSQLSPNNTCVKLFLNDDNIAFLPNDGIVLTGINQVKTTTINDYSWQQKSFPTGSGIFDLAVSPDGNWIAATTYADTVTLYHLPTQERDFVAKYDGSAKVAFFPNSQQWLVYNTDATWVYSLTGELLATLPKTRHVAFSSNGTELLLGIGKELVVWDVETWTQSRAIVLENNLYSGLFGFAYSPDGEIIAHLSNEGAYLANANTGELVKQWQGLDVEYTAEDSQFTPDGEWLVVQYNDLYEKGLLFLPVYKDTEFIKVELSDRYSIRDFAISADGRYLGVSDGRGTAIYDLPKLLENTE